MTDVSLRQSWEKLHEILWASIPTVKTFLPLDRIHLSVLWLQPALAVPRWVEDTSTAKAQGCARGWSRQICRAMSAGTFSDSYKQHHSLLPCPPLRSFHLQVVTQGLPPTTLFFCLSLDALRAQVTFCVVLCPHLTIAFPTFIMPLDSLINCSIKFLLSALVTKSIDNHDHGKHALQHDLMLI